MFSVQSATVSHYFSITEKIVFKENDLCVTSGLSINGRLFVTPREQLDALVSPQIFYLLQISIIKMWKY